MFLNLFTKKVKLSHAKSFTQVPSAKQSALLLSFVVTEMFSVQIIGFCELGNKSRL